MAVYPAESSVVLAALVLAGGRSSRMGQDKCLLRWRGQTLLHGVVNVAIAVADSVYVLTPWPERYQHLIPGSVQWLREPSTGLGPLAALANGLAEIEADWVLLLACDLPWLRVEVLRGWRSHLPQIDPQMLAYVPQGHHWEPLCGFYRPQALAALLDYMHKGGSSFQGWLNSHPAQPIRLSPLEAQMLHNCNTPAEWLACQQTLGESTAGTDSGGRE